MGARGPQPSGLSIVSGGVQSIERPKPPAELTPEEAAEWRLFINTMPADQYTQDTFPLLAQLCRHKINARRLAEAKQGITDTLDMLKVLEAEEKQSRTIAMLMTKLRLTPQSRYEPKKKRGTLQAKPWEFDK